MKKTASFGFLGKSGALVVFVAIATGEELEAEGDRWQQQWVHLAGSFDARRV